MRDSRDVQREVHDRLHAKDRTSRVHGSAVSSSLCHSYDLDTIVWETLAVLGEWNLVALEGLNDAGRRRLGDT